MVSQWANYKHYKSQVETQKGMQSDPEYASN